MHMSIFLLLTLLPQDAPTQAPNISDEEALTIVDATPFGLERNKPYLLAPAGSLGSGLIMDASEFTIHLSFTDRSFEGLRDGTERVSAATILDTWTTTVVDARRSSLNLEARYGFNDVITLSAGIPLERREASWSDGSNGGVTSNEGLGDIALGSEMRVLETESSRLTAGIGVIAPSGEHDAAGPWAGQADVLLPYGLQLGGGAWQGTAQASWILRRGTYALGIGALTTLPLNKNDAGWARERSLQVDAWIAKGFWDNWVMSLRAQASGFSDVRGDAAGLDPFQNPLEDNGRVGGDRIDLYGGLSVDLTPQDGVGSNRLEIALGLPVYEDLDGPGLAADFSLRLGWRLGF